MESFSSLMRTFGSSLDGIDFVASLPVEIAQIVLRNLDARSLIYASQVSRRWMAVCRSCPRLRKTAKSYLRKAKRNLVQDKFVLAKQTKLRSTPKAAAIYKDLTRNASHLESSVAQLTRISDFVFTAASNGRSNCTKTVPRFPPTSTRSSLRLR